MFHFLWRQGYVEVASYNLCCSITSNILSNFFDPGHSYWQDFQDFSVTELELWFHVVEYT